MKRRLPRRIPLEWQVAARSREARRMPWMDPALLAAEMLVARLGYGVCAGGWLET